MRALEMLELAHITQSATAAGMALVTPAVNSKHRRQLQRTLDDYQQLLRGIHARASGTVGDRYDSQGRTILRSFDEIRRFVDEVNDPSPKR